MPTATPGTRLRVERRGCFAPVTGAKLGEALVGAQRFMVEMGGSFVPCLPAMALGVTRSLRPLGLHTSSGLFPSFSPRHKWLLMVGVDLLQRRSCSLLWAPEQPRTGSSGCAWSWLF